MLRDYQALPFIALPPGSGYAVPTPFTLDHVQLDSPALEVMTDLARVTAVTALPSDNIDDAHRHMIDRGVRLLLVIDEAGKVLGVISANDVAGEKPVQIAIAQGLHRDEVQVRHCMTPLSRLQVLDINAVRAAKVGHIVATLKLAGRQHALVVERDAQQAVRVRGIFSATQIARQLGMAIQVNTVANTFHDIEAHISH